MHKITRISYNSRGWQRPTGDARKFEVASTYNHKYGFGHEDWLFRTEWLIDGWRYAFIQGVNKSHVKLVKAGQPIDLTLFTIQPDKRRRFVATIDAVECLDDRQAQDALKVFKKQGWYDTMTKEIHAVEGNASALGDAKWAKHILNVRFRQENVRRYAPGSFARVDDPIVRLTRYQLYDEEKPMRKVGRGGRTGTTTHPRTEPIRRHTSVVVEVSPEHARMQKRLMAELAKEYPQARILREQDFIDVSVRTEWELILFEIKSDLDPRTVIRLALGQVLEYAFHPSHTHPLPVRLVIVGRRPLSQLDAAYLEHLQSRFSLPLGYRVVEL